MILSLYSTMSRIRYFTRAFLTLISCTLPHIALFRKRMTFSGVISTKVRCFSRSISKSSCEIRVSSSFNRSFVCSVIIPCSIAAIRLREALSAAVRFVSSDFILALFRDFSLIRRHSNSASTLTESLSESSCQVELMTISSISFLEAVFSSQGFLSRVRVRQV